MTSIFIEKSIICVPASQCSHWEGNFWERDKTTLKALVLLGFSKKFAFPVPSLSFWLQPLFYGRSRLPNIYYVYIGMFFPRTHTYIQNVKTAAAGIQKFNMEVSE
tara:strand:- start:104 stop:418 length:315 start_codon:yes stop_codon:yes gene_type:complete